VVALCTIRFSNKGTHFAVFTGSGGIQLLALAHWNPVVNSGKPQNRLLRKFLKPEGKTKFRQ
jgi:hypothetical protein